MKKIPTIFERDWDGDGSRVLDKPHPDCAWVFDGEGVATRKLDGMCCMIKDGTLYKRCVVKLGTVFQPNFKASSYETTIEGVSRVPVGDGPEDKWHRVAFSINSDMPDGTYELVGPKVQRNAEDYARHCLIPHNDPLLLITEPFDRTFEGIKAFLTGKDIEGIVFHHCDGRMAKIKGRDFGLKRCAHGA